eukprot:10623_5
MTTWLGRSIISLAALASCMHLRTSDSGSTTGSMPFLKQLLKKMSAKPEAITALLSARVWDVESYTRARCTQRCAFAHLV